MASGNKTMNKYKTENRNKCKKHFKNLKEASARGRLWIKFNETNNEKPLKSKVRDRQENNSKTFLRPVPHLLGLSSRLFIVFCCFILSSLCSPHNFNWRLFAHWFLLFYLVAFCAPHASLPTALWYKMSMAYEQLYGIMY